MKNLYSQNVDQSTVDNLVSGTQVPCKVVPVAVSAGAATLPRGTLLSLGAGGEYEKFSSGKEIAAVLMLDADTTDPDEILGVPAAFSGEFNQNKIEEAAGVTLTTEEVAAARARQIYIAPMEPAPGIF